MSIDVKARAAQLIDWIHGARAFSEVEDALRASTLSNKQAAEWDVLMSEWMADTKLVTRNESVYANLEVPALG